MPKGAWDEDAMKNGKHTIDKHCLPHWAKRRQGHMTIQLQYGNMWFDYAQVAPDIHDTITHNIAYTMHDSIICYVKHTTSNMLS